jgi:O-antigen ligase
MKAAHQSMLMPPVVPGEMPYPMRTGAEPCVNSAPSVFSLRGLTPELWLILVFLVVTGVGDLRASKLGFEHLPVPLFLTDLTLLFLTTFSFARWPSRVLYWVSEGVGAGTVGRAVWILCIVAAIHFALAFPSHHIYAVRDLAIFWYSLYFPLTYFAIRKRCNAVTLLRYFIYAGVISAVLMVLQETVGLDLGLFDTDKREILNQQVIALRSGDANVFSVLSLSALSVYALFDRRHRSFHIVCIVACFVALAAAMVRSGVLGLVFATSLTFLYASPNIYRIRYGLVVAFFTLLIALSPAIPSSLPGSRLLRGLRISVLSAAGGPSVDANAKFRTVRWKYASEMWLAHPLFGVGFGVPIIPPGLVDPGERRGKFNAGMPHNSFLFFAARSGVVGVALVLYCWLYILKLSLAIAKKRHRSDDLAAACILASMLGPASLGLFFERPGTNASFWILVAVAMRLAES